jgi:integrase
LYLDFYPPVPHPETGKPSRREFLGMYVCIDKDEVKKEIKEKEKQEKPTKKLKELLKELKPLSPIDKQHNTDTLKLAEQIKQKRENYLNKPEIYSQYEKEQLRIKELSERNFVDYFRKLANEREGSNYNSWMSALNYLESFTGGNVKFSELNEAFFNEFRKYLQSAKSKRSKKANLSRNSAVSYFNKVKATLKQAYKDGILQTNLNLQVAPIEPEETRREYLTLEELNKLVKTHCNDILMKRAALFSALTGLRFSDIQKMVWGELEYIKDQGYRINYKQKKTANVEYHDISEQAFSLLGEPGDPSQKVFDGLIYSAYNNRHLHQWIGAAGITKDITFHCFRHTYATLLLANDTDITTVQKMLGHKDLKTTMIYAKVVDRTKREAADKIKLDL